MRARSALAAALCLGAYAYAAQQKKVVDPAKSLVELTADDLNSNLDFWTQDMAVMFYAPWCPHCKKFLPTWAMVAENIKADYPKGDADHVVGRFDCESKKHPENFELCVELGVGAYPTFKVLGFGDYRDRSIFAGLFGRRNTRLDRVVEFRGLRYYDAVRDWTRAMFSISAAQRAQARVRSLLGFRTPLDPTPQLRQLTSANRVLRSAVVELTALARAGGSTSATSVAAAAAAAAAVGGESAWGGGRSSSSSSSRSSASGTGGGKRAEGAVAGEGGGAAAAAGFDEDGYDDTLREDQFAKLSAVAYGDEALLTCVAQRAVEYCDALADARESGKDANAAQLAPEPYCALLDACLETGFEDATCRPEACPFRSVGCTHVAQCARADLQAYYTELLADVAKEEEEAAAAVTAAVPGGRASGKEGGAVPARGDKAAAA